MLHLTFEPGHKVLPNPELSLLPTQTRHRQILGQFCFHLVTLLRYGRQLINLSEMTREGQVTRTKYMTRAGVATPTYSINVGHGNRTSCSVTLFSLAKHKKFLALFCPSKGRAGRAESVSLSYEHIPVAYRDVILVPRHFSPDGNLGGKRKEHTQTSIVTGKKATDKGARNKLSGSLLQIPDLVRIPLVIVGFFSDQACD